MAWRRRIHRTRRLVQGLFATLVIGLALLAGLFHLGLPWLAGHPERVGEFLSARLNRAVTVERVDGLWESNGPLLVLKGVRIAGATTDRPATVIPQAELKINFFSWLSRNQTWNEFRLIGLNLGLNRDVAGNWQLRGLDAGSGADQGGDSNALFDLGSLVVRDLRLNIDDALTGHQIVLGADEVRLINAGEHHRVLARVRCLQTQSPPLDAVVDYNSDDNSGEIYLGGSQLDLAAVLHTYPIAGLALDHGSGRAQVWAWWSRGRLDEARVEVDLMNLVLTTPATIAIDDKRQIAPRIAFDRMAFGARWRRGDNGWQADVADLVLARQGEVSLPANIHVEKYHTNPEAAAGYALNAQGVDIAAPASVAMLSDALPASLRRWLYQADPVGKVRTATLRYDGAQDFDLATTLDGISWHAVDKLPGVSGLSGTLLGDRDAFTLSLPTHSAFGIDAAHLFRQPLEFTEFSGTLAAYRTDAPLAGSNPPTTDNPQPTTGSGWRLETDALDFEGAGYGGELAGAVELHDDGSRPLLDVYAAITHADVRASHLFWPINSMSPAGVSFLDRALDAGRVASVRAVFRGDLADWPFRNSAGRFDARADVEDVRFVYLPDWPAAEHLNGIANFLNTTLHVDVSSVQAQGVKVSAATVDIADLGEVVLDLTMSGSGTGKDLLGFLKATPLGQRFGAQLLGVDVGGQGKLDFRLHQPVKQHDQLDLAGTVALTDADLTDAKYNLHLNKANGKVRFTQRGFTTDDLAVTMNGAPADFTLAVGGFTADPHHAVEANLSATLPARDVLAYAPPLQSYSDHISGSALWHAGFSADSDSVGASGAQRLTLNSDLRGVTLDLPAPLKKAAGDALPLALTLGMPVAGGSIDLHIADWLHMRGRLTSLTQPFAARVDLGTPGHAPLPAAGFAIDGNVAQLDLSGWLDVAMSGSSGGGMLAGVDLRADSLSVYARDFGATSFKLTPGGSGLDLGFSGANIDGSLLVPAADLHQRGITAQFTRLYWPEVAESQTTALAGENPVAVPPLHVHIGDFRLGEANLGDATLETYPIADGMHFEQVGTRSGNLEMRAHGDWTGRPGSDRSHFSIDFTAHNLGRMLDAFGYAGVVDGGQTVAHIDGSWDGSPSTFALARLDGSLKVSIAQGRIPEADPGAGRIFGLFNLGAIPRRLTLDFGDLFKTGFSFDSIAGLFTLKDGNAVTSDLEVKGPTADIRVSGRTGLKSKDYDQIMDVTPHVGGTLAVGGALVGGPVGAAAGALLQGIFKNQINQVASVRYSVTGSWEKPTVTPLAKESVKPAARGKQSGKATTGNLHGTGL